MKEKVGSRLQRKIHDRADDAIVRRLDPDSEQWDIYFKASR